MQRTTIKWGTGGSLFFPAVALLLAFWKDSLLPYPSTALSLLNQALEVLSIPPLLVMDAVFPTGKERYWIYVYVLVVLYLAVLGFGIGVLLGKAFRFAMNKSN
jgi:hypothetical protein